MFHSEAEGFWSILKVVPSNLTVKRISKHRTKSPSIGRIIEPSTPSFNVWRQMKFKQGAGPTITKVLKVTPN